MQTAAFANPHTTQRSRAAVTPQTLPHGVRARLKLGGAQDEVEKQADRIAAHALQDNASTGGDDGGYRAATQGRVAVRRALTGAEEGGRLAEPAEEEQVLPERLEQEVAALQAGGQPLPPPLRAEMEARFGMDFSTVRIHNDGASARLNDILHAHAFTVGEHIAFNRGRFQPHSARGRFLLAHELAHVAQRRGAARGVEAQPVRRGFWGDLYHSAADTLGNIAHWAVSKVREFGWKLLERISPEFARTVRAIVDQGILKWLGRKVARAWDVFIGGLRALVPFDGPRKLIDLFSGLVTRAARVAAALMSGNCKPLMAAIADLKKFVTDVVGVAWDKLSAFLRPIGDFFKKLWTNYGLTAVKWLEDFGGTVWQGILTLGRRFWEWIRPVREAASRIWNWFSNLLFGPSEGGGSSSSEGGVLGWIKRKAGEAWNWVKEKTRPVWQPVVNFATKVAKLIPPAFVREMGEHAQQLSNELGHTAAGMDGGDGVPRSRQTLKSVLPSVQKVIATVRRIIVGAGQWLTGQISAIAGSITHLMARLRANTWLSWLAGAFNWLSEALNSLLSWGRDKVAVLFRWMVQGFDALTPFLKLVLETVQKLITIFGDLMKLPLLILSGIWHKVPACIRVPVENFIKNQILARIPVFGQFFSNPQLWPRVRQTALNILRRIFVNGDILGAAWLFFRGVLRILGIPAQLVVQILAKAAGAIGAILVNPIGFLINTLRAIRAGFGRFFSNIGTHLLNGVTGWLFGQLRDAGIRPPADFSLRSVLGFVLETLGISSDNVFRRLAARVGQSVVDRLRRMLSLATGVWSFVAVLVNEGPAGLWRMLRERISSLWTTVLNGVIGWITERIINRAVRWLLGLLDPTGIMPVINSLIAIYNAIQSFAQYLRQMLEILNRVLDGILGIARGAIGAAAGFLEDALARALPVAIGFLANQFGLGRLSGRIREILGRVRGVVDRAIDWLIGRAIRMGQGVINLVRRGAAAVGRGVARVREWWRTRLRFRAADGHEHSLYFRGQGAGADLIVESEPESFQTFLNSCSEGADKVEAQRLYNELRRVQRTAGATPAPAATPAAATATASPSERIVELTHQLSTVAARLMTNTDTTIAQATPPVFGSLRQGFGTSVEVNRLTRRIPPGSPPSIEGGLWDTLRRRRHGSSSYYIRGHLLNHHIGGPGYTWANLTPLTRTANTSMSSSFEEAVKTAVQAGKTIFFRVNTVPGTPPDRSAEIAALRNPENPNTEDRTIASVMEAERAVPRRITGVAREVPANTPATAPALGSWREVASLNQDNVPDFSLDSYNVSDGPRTPVSLSNSPHSLIRQLPGVTDALAERIMARQQAGVTFRTRGQFTRETGAPNNLFDGFRRSSRFIVRLYSVGGGTGG